MINYTSRLNESYEQHELPEDSVVEFRLKDETGQKGSFHVFIKDGRLVIRSGWTINIQIDGTHSISIG